MMPRAYVVAEDRAGAEILKRVLPDELTRDVRFVDGGGPSSANSRARSLVLVKQLPLAFVFDTKTTDSRTVAEHLDLLRYYMGHGPAGIPVAVLAAVPEIEAVFFQDRSLVERVTGQHFTDREWHLACRDPRESLTMTLGDRATAVQQLLDGLGEANLAVIRQHPVIRELTDFLSAVPEPAASESSR